jgi:hypothetical protein
MEILQPSKIPEFVKKSVLYFSSKSIFLQMVEIVIILWKMAVF